MSTVKYARMNDAMGCVLFLLTIDDKSMERPACRRIIFSAGLHVYAALCPNPQSARHFARVRVSAGFLSSTSNSDVDMCTFYGSIDRGR
jgi:hypothetical protein